MPDIPHIFAGASGLACPAAALKTSHPPLSAQQIPCTKVANVMSVGREPLPEVRLNDAQREAAIIVNRGRGADIDPQGMETARLALQSAATNPASEVADIHIRNTIADTLKETFASSWTFNQTVRYCLDDTPRVLENLGFSNASTLASCPDDSAGVCADDSDRAVLAQQGAQTANAAAEAEAEGQWHTIYVTAPPPPHSNDMDAWKAELIHQVMRVLTGASQSEAAPEVNDGVRLLAHAVAIEMGWQVADEPSNLQPVRPRLSSNSDAFAKPSRMNRQATGTLAPPERKASAVSRLSSVDTDFLTELRNLGLKDPAKAAREIQTMDTWDSDTGDFVPALAARLFPELQLTIINKSLGGTARVKFVDAQPAVKEPHPLTLVLEKDHYVVVDDDEKNTKYFPPKDGNCFYSCLLYAKQGEAFSRDDIQALRNQVAHYLTSLS